MATLTWESAKNGWGLTEYRAKVSGGTYLARRSGGRHLGWELRFVKPDEFEHEAARISSCATLRSAKSIAEMTEARKETT